MEARYTVSLTKRAERERRKLPDDIQDRIEESLKKLAEEPRPPGCRKLQHSNEWRIRVGEYRIRYEIDDENRLITVTRIAHRREVY